MVPDRAVMDRSSDGGTFNRQSGLPGAATPMRERAERLSLRVVPLAPLLVALSLGIVVDRFVEPWETWSWAILAAACGGFAALLFRRETLAGASVLAAFCAIGGGWHHSWWTDRDCNDLCWSATESPRPAWIRGVVRDAMGVRRNGGHGFGPRFGFEPGDLSSARTRFVVDATAISDGERWSPVSGRAIMIVAGDRSDIRGGEAFEALGHLSRVGGPLNPGEFDYRGFLRGQRIDLRLVVDDPEALKRDPRATSGAFGMWLGALRAWSRAQLVDRLDARIEPLASAFLLGQREGVEPEVNDAFARTGTTHLLAISGLHLQVLAVALLLVARVLGVPRRPAYVAVALLTTGYAVLVGPAPSVVRSTVMTVTFCMAAIVQRAARPANTLALAGIGTLAANPANLFDIGCQLSFLAIAALIWLVPPVCRLVRRGGEAIRSSCWGPRSPLDDLEQKLEPRWRASMRRMQLGLVDGIVASAVVWLAALPLVAQRFHIVSPIGILLNIPLIPLTSAALLLGGLGLLLSAVWAPLGGPPSWAGGWMLDVTQSVVLWGVARPWGHWFVAGPAWGWVLVFYSVLGWAAISVAASARSPLGLSGGRFWRRTPWWMVAAWPILGWVVGGVTAGAIRPEAEFLAVGHGLAVITQTPGGQTLLYDCGRMGDPTVGRRIIAPALWSRGITRINTIVLSHADFDHYDGLPDLLDRFSIGRVCVPPGFGGPANPAATQLVQRIRSHGIPVLSLAAHEVWESDGVRFTVRHPPAIWHAEASDNARSVVLEVAHDGRCILLTGDLEQMGLVELVAQPRPDPPPDFMLAPHHGGKSANPVWLYEWARPRALVVSQRPVEPGASDALAPFALQGVPLWRTWREGSIRLRWTGVGIVAHGFRENRGQERDALDRARPSPDVNPTRKTISMGARDARADRESGP
jgi:competence protein ComEC